MNLKLPKVPFAPSPQLAGSACSQLIQAWKDCKNIHEVETTKREFIRAQRDVALERCKNQREILELYLTKTFEERATTIEGFFRTLDEGIKTGNNQLIGFAMQEIVAVVQTSPLQGMTEFMQQLEDPSVKCIEI